MPIDRERLQSHGLYPGNPDYWVLDTHKRFADSISRVDPERAHDPDYVTALRRSITNTENWRLQQMPFTSVQLSIKIGSPRGIVIGDKFTGIVSTEGIHIPVGRSLGFEIIMADHGNNSRLIPYGVPIPGYTNRHLVPLIEVVDAQNVVKFTSASGKITIEQIKYQIPASAICGIQFSNDASAIFREPISFEHTEPFTHRPEPGSAWLN